MWETFTKILINLIFPEFCCSCGTLGCLLCDDCYERLHFLSLPIKPELEKCYLTQINVVLQYNPTSRQLISELKYKSVKNVSKILGELIYYAVELPKVDLITAVPLHPNRQRLRGFNQAELIAQELSRLADVPFAPLLMRTADTVQQAKQSSKAKRLKALSGAFKLTVPSGQVSGKTILLIDDVVTTGTTINECAKLLNNCDSSDIYGLTIASNKT